MTFGTVLALVVAGFCMTMILGFVALVALVSSRNRDGGIDWFTKSVVAISVGLVAYVVLQALGG